MTRRPGFTNYCCFSIVLLMTLLLASCEQFGYLTCAIIPSTDLLIPPKPYDEVVGDCALVGKSEEVEIWLTELESITESCRADREPNWEDTLATRVSLDSRIDNLEEVGPLPTPTNWRDGDLEEVCYFNYGNAELPDEYRYPLPSHYYTYWLMRISDNVEKYCTMIDELIKPLQQACDEINYYQDCQNLDVDKYHAIVEARMNIAQTKYDSTELFFTYNLQTLGWENFRQEFDEPSLAIACPRKQQTSVSTFTFSMNAFCRIGPSLEYGKTATFLELQNVQVEGRNKTEPRWWWVRIPGTSEHCWVSDSTGLAEGISEDLKIVADPPLDTNKQKDQPKSIVCSSDLTENACGSAGGTWKTSPLGPPYCDCK